MRDSNFSRINKVFLLILFFSFGVASGNQTPSHSSIKRVSSSPALNQNIFYPSTTSSARTLGHLKYSWQPTPGTELDDFGWFNNTVSLGLGERFEVGIKPIFYLFVVQYSTA